MEQTIAKNLDRKCLMSWSLPSLGGILLSNIIRKKLENDEENDAFPDKPMGTIIFAALPQCLQIAKKISKFELIISRPFLMLSLL